MNQILRKLISVKIIFGEYSDQGLNWDIDYVGPDFILDWDSIRTA